MSNSHVTNPAVYVNFARYKSCSLCQIRTLQILQIRTLKTVQSVSNSHAKNPSVYVRIRWVMEAPVEANKHQIRQS